MANGYDYLTKVYDKDCLDIVPLSGKDSLLTAIILKEMYPHIDFLYVFNDTGLELPETYQWLNDIEYHLNINIIRIGKNLNDIIKGEKILPSPKKRFCTRKAKIYPFEDWIGKNKAYVYFGIRYDERHRLGYNPPKKLDITPIYPLIENRLNLAHVYKIVPPHLMPPAFFWPELFIEVKKTLAPLGIKLEYDNLTDVQKRVLFSWRSRPNCYDCFFMRYYEFVGLHNFHPALFWEAVKKEETIGGDGFTIRAKSLRVILKNRKHYIAQRAKQVVKILTTQSFFNDDPDLLVVSSCGLWCAT